MAVLDGEGDLAVGEAADVPGQSSASARIDRVRLSPCGDWERIRRVGTLAIEVARGVAISDAANVVRALTLGFPNCLTAIST